MLLGRRRPTHINDCQLIDLISTGWSTTPRLKLSVVGLINNSRSVRTLFTYPEVWPQQQHYSKCFVLSSLSIHLLNSPFHPICQRSTYVPNLPVTQRTTSSL